MSNIVSKHKRIVLVTLLSVYLLLILCFGTTYHQIANRSSERPFIFEEDITLKRKVAIFKKRVGIEGTDIDQRLTKLFVDFVPEEYESTRNLDRMHRNLWLSYYIHVFRQKGYTHFGFRKIEEGATHVYKGREEQQTDVEIGLYAHKKKSAEKWMDLTVYPKEMSDQFDLIDTINISMFDFVERFRYFLESDGYYHPINLGIHTIVFDGVFPDKNYDIFKEVKEEKIKYPLLDFLYFSTVTITTLGYGDILPNSTCIRVLVMIETLLGIVVLGLFISCVFSGQTKCP